MTVEPVDFNRWLPPMPLRRAVVDIPAPAGAIDNDGGIGFRMFGMVSWVENRREHSPDMWIPGQASSVSACHESVVSTYISLRNKTEVRTLLFAVGPTQLVNELPIRPQPQVSMVGTVLGPGGVPGRLVVAARDEVVVMCMQSEAGGCTYANVVCIIVLHERAYLRWLAFLRRQGDLEQAGTLQSLDIIRGTTPRDRTH